MSLHDLNLTDRNSNLTAEQSETLARYKQTRKIATDLNNRMVRRLSTATLQKGAKKLGLLHRGIFVYESEEEMDILMDYCIHNIQENGRNAVQQFLMDSPPVEDSEEMVILRAMQHTVFSLFIVESIEPGNGLIVRNLVSDEPIFIVDIGLSSCAKPGLVMASRLIFYDGFATTSGISLPVGCPSKKAMDLLMKKPPTSLSPSKNGFLNPAPLIKSFLMKGGASSIRFQEPSANRNVTPTLSATEHRPKKIGRNSPCPCDSGRKYKHCCLRQG